jgi:hypothetical protein
VDLSESERGALIGRMGVIDCAIDHRVLLVPSCPAFGPYSKIHAGCPT